jgi:hypothetical protein
MVKKLCLLTLKRIFKPVAGIMGNYGKYPLKKNIDIPEAS